MKNNNENGSALLMALIMLFVMTLLASSSFNNALFNKKIMSSFKLYESALQNAHISLKETENSLLTAIDLNSLELRLSGAGIYSSSATNLFQNEDHMQSLPDFDVNNGISKRYIEKIGNYTSTSNPTEIAQLFRVTVMAFEDGYLSSHSLMNKQPKARVLLQSTVAVNIDNNGTTVMPNHLKIGRISWRELVVEY